jgi:hypothetical protein
MSGQRVLLRILRNSDVEQRAFAHVWESVGLYERIQGEEHPVRAWERGEVQAIAAAS